jgi:5-methylcytosine-specific restriction endonuclease McrA
MTVAMREAVLRRARNRCEYCRIHQDDIPFLRHQIEHVTPRQHGGSDDLANLALACYRCNKYKGPNLSAFDPRTRKLVRLFNPRRQRWTDHFSIRGVLVLGRTTIGRATVELLCMNATKMQILRREIAR